MVIGGVMDSLANLLGEAPEELGCQSPVECFPSEPQRRRMPQRHRGTEKEKHREKRKWKMENSECKNGTTGEGAMGR
jgi:hypothetical protein